MEKYKLEVQMTVQEAGRKGGLSRSPKKIAAVRKNIAKVNKMKRRYGSRSKYNTR